MKRIPRQVPSPKTSRQGGAAQPQTEARTWPDVCIAGRPHMAPGPAALLVRLRHERDLRLERGLISEAAGIDLALCLICEAAQSAPAQAEPTDPA